MKKPYEHMAQLAAISHQCIQYSSEKRHIPFETEKQTDDK